MAREAKSAETRDPEDAWRNRENFSLARED
jgi:hypothetical protein